MSAGGSCTQRAVHVGIVSISGVHSSAIFSAAVSECGYGLGYPVIATTSLGLANMLGSVTVSLDAIIENCRVIAQATDLPVNADLENCGADDPKTAAPPRVTAKVA